MASSTILSSKAFNKLQINRLDAKEIRSNNISSLTPSYLFSAVFNGNFIRNSTGGILRFTSSDVVSIIQFTDRPLRQTEIILFDDFVSLFETKIYSNNSFEDSPPNAVLVHKEEQRTYIVRESLHTDEFLKLSLELLPGETHNISTVNGSMNLFVDGDTDGDSDILQNAIEFIFRIKDEADFSQLKSIEYDTTLISISKNSTIVIIIKQKNYFIAVYDNGEPFTVISIQKPIVHLSGNNTISVKLYEQKPQLIYNNKYVIANILQLG